MKQCEARCAEENQTRLSMLRLLCAVSVWRSGVMLILPAAGSAAWWVMLVCLLPGLGTAALLRLTMHMTRTKSLTETVRACLGATGVRTVSVLLSALLLSEALAEMTLLMTLFTQEIGTRGTRFTTALLTGAALLLCMHRDGLPRAVHFLRWPVAAAAGVAAAYQLMQGRADHLYPLCGEGSMTSLTAVRAGVGMAWPAVLLLTVQPACTGRLRGAVLPVFAAAAALLLLTLDVPQELMADGRSWAGMLLPVRYAPNALGILSLCLMMTTIFMSIAASVLYGAEILLSPMKRCPKGLPYAVTLGLILTQAGNVTLLDGIVDDVQLWLAAGLAGVAAVCLPAALIRRKNA